MASDPSRLWRSFWRWARSKVYQLMESGDLRFVKIGKSRRIRWPDVLRLVDEHTVGGER